MRDLFNREDIIKYTVKDNSNFYEVLEHVDKNSKQMAVVINDEGEVKGVITDGDLRRAMLKGYTLESKIKEIMNVYPVTAPKQLSRKSLISKMQEKSMSFLPVVDENNHLLEIVFLSDLLNLNRKRNSVIIMAGGLGTRLEELTDECPKPMLRVGNRPILETIISHLSSFGFYDFHISVNHLKEQIMEYFEDGESLGVKISYLHEKEPLGTAGALANFNPQNSEPVITMNGDIYTDIDFTSLIDSHKSSNAQATVCLRKYDYQIPYGVVKTDNKQITAIEEKPVLSYFVNAGIYVFNPKILEIIPKDTYYPMTKFLEELLKKGNQVHSHLVEGIWIDIGRRDDFNNASDIAMARLERSRF